MKQYVLVLICLFVIISCDKISTRIDRTDLYGYWINNSNEFDTLLFTDTLIHRTHFLTADSGLANRYDFELIRDSIHLYYRGIDKIYIPKPFIRKVIFEKETMELNIVEMNSVYPGYDGEVFTFLKK